MTTKWPNLSPNQLYSTKISPKSLGNFFLEKNRPMLKTFAQMAKKNFQSGHTDFQRKTDLG
jgi:hypothetical protein